MLIALQIISFPNCAGGEEESSPHLQSRGAAGLQVPAPRLFWGHPVSAGARSIPRRDSCKKPPNPVHRELGAPARPRHCELGERPRTGGVSGGAAGTPGCVSLAGVSEHFQLLRMRPHPSSSPSSALGKGARGWERDPPAAGNRGCSVFNPPHGRMQSFAAAAFRKKDFNWLLYGVMMLI